MDKRTRELIEQFQAVDDTGAVHTIRVFADVHHITMLDGSQQRVEGMKSYALANGNHVNLEDDGTLVNVHTGRRMRRR